MNTETKTFTLEQIEKALLCRVQGIVEELSQGQNREPQTPEEIFAKALGSYDAFCSVAEQLGIPSEHLHLDQLHAAAGERFRRLFPDKNQFKFRALNNVLNAVRDLRIETVDNYKILNYQADVLPLKRKLKKIDRVNHDNFSDYWPVFSFVQRELNALNQFNLWHVADRSWFGEHYRREQEAKKQPHNPQPTFSANAQP